MKNFTITIDKDSIIDRCKVASAMVAKAGENFDLMTITDDDVRITDTYYNDVLSNLISYLSRYSALLVDGKISLSIFGDFNEDLIPTLKSSIEDFITYGILSLWLSKVDEKSAINYAGSMKATLVAALSILSKRTKPI